MKIRVQGCWLEQLASWLGGVSWGRARASIDMSTGHSGAEVLVAPVVPTLQLDSTSVICHVCSPVWNLHTILYTVIGRSV